jgi:hypothetical protein
MKCNETLGKWCKNKHGASKIIDTFETYQTAKQCMVGTTDVHHLEPDGVAAAVSVLLEENLQLHLAQRGARMPRHDAMEGEPARFQLSKRDAQLLQRASVKKVDAAAAVNEHAREPAHVRIGAHDRVQD